MPETIERSADGIFEFNRILIDATHRYCVAFKPNIAFYECLGSAGWMALEKTIAYIKERCPDVFTIADAKRGDIGSTSDLYARAFFERMDFDAVTVSPYMGRDSVSPFLKYKNKWVILLGLTSNKGAEDFQLKDMLFQRVLQISRNWGSAENMMYVIGGTRPEMLEEARKLAPDNFFLVPGIGAQGGKMAEVVKYGLNSECGLLLNLSRSIIYAGKGTDFAMKAKEESEKIQMEMEKIVRKF